MTAFARNHQIGLPASRLHTAHLHDDPSASLPCVIAKARSSSRFRRRSKNNDPRHRRTALHHDSAAACLPVETTGRSRPFHSAEPRASRFRRRSTPPKFATRSTARYRAVEAAHRSLAHCYSLPSLHRRAALPQHDRAALLLLHVVEALECRT